MWAGCWGLQVQVKAMMTRLHVEVLSHIAVFLLLQPPPFLSTPHVQADMAKVDCIVKIFFTMCALYLIEGGNTWLWTRCLYKEASHACGFHQGQTAGKTYGSQHNCVHCYPKNNFFCLVHEGNATSLQFWSQRGSHSVLKEKQHFGWVIPLHWLAHSKNGL